MSKIFHAINFHVKQFSDEQPCTALSLILHMYFRAFNFRISQAVRKYFNNEIFAIYGKWKKGAEMINNYSLKEKLYLKH